MGRDITVFGDGLQTRSFCGLAASEHRPELSTIFCFASLSIILDL